MAEGEEIRKVDPSATNPVVVTVPDREAHTENPLAVKLRIIRNNAKARGEDINRRSVVIVQLQQQLESPQPPDDSEELKPFAEAVDELEDLKKQDLIKEGFITQAASDIRAVRHQVVELGKLVAEEQELDQGIWRAKFAVDDLGSNRGWRRLTALTKVPKYRIAVRQREAEKTLFIQRHGGLPSEKLDQILRTENDFFAELGHRTDEATTQNAQDIRSDFTDFYKDVISSPLMQQVEEICLNDYIIPSLMEASSRHGGASVEQVREAEERIRTLLQSRPTGEAAENALNQIFQPPFNFNEDEKRLCRSILNSETATIVKGIIGQIAQDSSNDFLDSINSPNNPDKLRNILFEDQDMPFKTATLDVGSTSVLQSIRLWKALTRSPLAKEVFGEYLDKIDQQFYHQILGKAFESPGRNDLLVAGLDEYPNPDTLVSLLLLSVEHPSGYLYTINHVIRSFAKRSDWENLLQDTISQYPGFEQIIPTLQYYREETIAGDIDPLVLRFAPVGLKDQVKALLGHRTSIERLPVEARKFTLGIFSPEELAQKLAEWNIVTAQDAEDLRVAYEIVQQIDTQRTGHVLPLQRAILANAQSALFGDISGNDERARDLGKQAVLYYVEVAKNLQRLSSETVSNTDRVKNYLDFYLNENILQFLAKRPDGSDIVFSFPEHGSLLMAENMRNTVNFILSYEDLLLNDMSDLRFLNKLAEIFGPDVDYFMTQYLEGVQRGEFNPDNREQFIEKYKVFAQTHTTFSQDRLNRFQSAAETPFGRVLAGLVPDEVERNKMLLDYACFTERLETNKVNLIVQRMKDRVNGEDLRQIFEYLRWLPEAEVSKQDTLDSIKTKYQVSQERLIAGFNKIFPNAQEIIGSPQNFNNLKMRLNDICERFRLETRLVSIGEVRVNLPREFIREFNTLRRTNPETELIPELAAFLINQSSHLSTAYTVEDLLFSQIGETEDQTGRRRGRYTAEQLLQVMESNIEASLHTWSTAINYQRERPASPLFVIANERTGPADLAAEYLPKEFADQFQISQNVNYDKFFEWFQQSETLIESLYARNQRGEDVRGEIPEEVLSFLGADSHAIIPIYRLKVPSSLNAASEEPEGINTVLNFLKFTSLLGGRSLFMDESTRSAPRSIECLYNVLNRRQQDLGGARMRLFGKIKGVQGQNGTLLQEVQPRSSQIEIGFIDPWHSQIKSVTDDSVGFVPEVTGRGVVEVVQPSYTSISPYGISTVQDFWKQLIANEVSMRFGGFEESGGVKKRREEFKPAPSETEDLLRSLQPLEQS